MTMSSHQKAAEQQRLNITRRLSGQLTASGYYGVVDIPPDWLLVEVGKMSSQALERLGNKGPIWSYWEERTRWTSDFKGWYMPNWLAELLPEETRLIRKEREQLIAERDRWVASHEHEKEKLTVWSEGDPDCWHQDGVHEERFSTTIHVPKGWILLKAGDPLITRRVKSKGQYWLFKHQKGRYKNTVGLFAPSVIIEEEQQKVELERGSEAYKLRLQSQKQWRDKREEQYCSELEDAMVRYLNFAPQYEDLARDIATAAAAEATEVGSGRVGRTGYLSLEEKAWRAVRAYIRHKYTDYEKHLNNSEIPLERNDILYNMIKEEASRAVDEFLRHHRESS